MASSDENSFSLEPKKCDVGENSIVDNVEHVDISFESEESNILNMMDITKDMSGGVMKRILRVGDGDEHPCYGDRVSVYYTGWLVGTSQKPVKFDGNRDGDKCEFFLGKGTVIKGWDLAISTMTRKECSLFIIQSEYAYGPIGYPPNIPPHATLLFEIELVDWKLEDLSQKKDGSILRKIVQRGEGPAYPNEGSFVKIRLRKRFEDEFLGDEEKEFILGEGCMSDVLEEIESALLKFHLNEKSLIFVKSKHHDNEKHTEQEALQYEVTLLSFTNAKDVWEMNSDEKLQKAKISKQKGVSFMEGKNLKIAIKQFRCIISCLENEPGVQSDTEEERNLLLLSAYLNIALCHMKLQNYVDVIKACNKALKQDPGNEKALFRRGQAKLKINDSKEALQDFQSLVNIYPENNAAKKYILLCKQNMGKQAVKDKSTYNEMFAKFKKQDELKMKNMKTETGVWEDKEVKNAQPMTEEQRFLEQSNSALLEANIIELSNTALQIK